MHTLLLIAFLSVPPVAPPVEPPVELPEHAGEPVVAVKPCQCGDVCECADCQCAECPHSKGNGQKLYDADREVKDSLPTLLRPHTLFFSAPWCGPCKPAKESLAEVFSGPHGEVYKRCLTFVDADTSPRRMAFYGVSALPCYVLIDDELNVIARHVGVMTADQYREFVDANTLPKGTGRVTHDAQRHEVAKPVQAHHVSPGLHSHQCPCGNRWTHDANAITDFYSAHTCRRCGRLVTVHAD